MSKVIVSRKTPNGFLMEVNKQTVVINGYNSDDSLIIVKDKTVGITYDVDEAFFDKWVEQNKTHPLYTGGFVFKTKDERSARSQAKEKANLKTGLEQKTKAELDKVAGATEVKKDEE